MDRKVSTAYLKLGMYVSKLDRPWGQTPFLIQGFFIEEESDISKLVEYCDYVYIDIEMGEKADLYLDTAPPLSNPKFHVKQRLAVNKQLETILNTGKKSVKYIDQKTTIQELPDARAAIEKASASITRIMEHDIRKGQLDVANVKEAVEPVLNSVIRNSDAFMWLSKMQDHDSYSYDHSVQNCALGIAFGRHLGLNRKDLTTLATGLLLMDIGKIKLPKALLAKTTPPTQEEVAIIRKHVAFSVDLLRQAKGMNEHIINIALTHHERYDGSGYPNGLVGTQTPAFGRMAAIIDCYDSMISSAPYKQAIPEHKALQNIYNLSDKLFQKDLVQQFIQCMGVYPTGSLVELTSGAVGAVLSQNTEQKMKPSLLMLLDEKKQPLKKQRVFDLVEHNKTPLFIAKSLENNAYGVDIRLVKL
jgi:HD-GYP domain-containing protein (c-di-GMP phosphodiesterase class II)